MNTHTQNQAPPPDQPKLHRDERPKAPFDKSIITFLGLCTGAMMTISLMKLIPESGPVANFKALLLAGSSTLVAYGVNRFAIERGAPLAAVGFRAAGIASVAAILIAGSGMAVGAFSGMTHSAIDGRVLHNNGAALTLYIAQVNESAIDAGRAGPALRMVADDLERYANCETKRSCLSRVGSGGYGPVADSLHKRSTRANAMASTFNNGAVESAHILKDLNALGARYQKILGDTSLTHTQQRVALHPIHAQIEQLGAALKEVLPIHLLKNYAQELQGGVTINGQRRASQAVSALLKQHGDALTDTLDTLSRDEIKAPIFPQRPGMLASLAFMDDFAAFAIVIIVAELILPLTLWILTFQRLRWEIERRSPSMAPTPIAPDSYDGILSLPPLVHTRLPQSEAPKRLARPHPIQGRVIEDEFIDVGAVEQEDVSNSPETKRLNLRAIQNAKSIRRSHLKSGANNGRGEGS